MDAKQPRSVEPVKVRVETDGWKCPGCDTVTIARGGGKPKRCSNRQECGRTFK